MPYLKDLAAGLASLCVQLPGLWPKFPNFEGDRWNRPAYRDRRTSIYAGAAA